MRPAAVGVSSAAETVIVTVAVLLALMPSVTYHVNESAPETSRNGEYVACPYVGLESSVSTTTRPFAVCVRIESAVNTNGLPSASVASKGMRTGVSSDAAAEESTATGATVFVMNDFDDAVTIAPLTNEPWFPFDVKSVTTPASKVQYPTRSDSDPVRVYSMTACI